jgi:hypothetical protein
LPTRPARKDDDDRNPHLEAFEAQHGEEAVELDALPPDELRNMVREVILNHIDDAHIERIKEQEEDDREKLTQALADILD